MAVAPDMERKTTTIPKAHVMVYEAEVKRRRVRGERTSVAELIREAIARDVKRIERRR